jgi:hypothetical protein
MWTEILDGLIITVFLVMMLLALVSMATRKTGDSEEVRQFNGLAWFWVEFLRRVRR